MSHQWYDKKSPLLIGNHLHSGTINVAGGAAQLTQQPKTLRETLTFDRSFSLDLLELKCAYMTFDMTMSLFGAHQVILAHNHVLYFLQK